MINPDAPTRFYFTGGYIAENKDLPPVGKTERIYLLVRDHIQHYGYAPTYAEIGNWLHILSTHTVFYHLNKLETCGAIKRVSDISRGIVLT